MSIIWTPATRGLAASFAFFREKERPWADLKIKGGRLPHMKSIFRERDGGGLLENSFRGRGVFG